MRQDRSFQPASSLIIATAIALVVFVSGCQPRYGHYYAGGAYYSGHNYPYYGYYGSWWPSRYYYGPHGRSYYHHRNDYYRHRGDYDHRGDGRGRNYHHDGQKPPQQQHQGRPQQLQPTPQRGHGDRPYRMEQPRTQHRQSGQQQRYAPQQRQRGDQQQLEQPQQPRGREQLRSPRQTHDYRPPQSHMGGQGRGGQHGRR